jgi:hypothetical protein
MNNQQHSNKYDNLLSKKNSLIHIRMPADYITSQPERPTTMYAVYLAGHLADAKKFQAIRKEWDKADGLPRIYVNSRWIDLVGLLSESAALAREFWQMDMEDIAQAAALVIGTTNSKAPLRGALVEVGAALSCGIPVLVVGTHPSFGTWQHHSGVIHVDSYDEAFLWLRLHFGKVNGITSLNN